MSYVTGLQCVHCARDLRREEVEYYCPACGYHDGILDVTYDYEAMQEGINSDPHWHGSADYSMWRYLPLLPVDDAALIPHLQVGWTPLYDAPRLAES